MVPTECGNAKAGITSSVIILCLPIISLAATVRKQPLFPTYTFLQENYRKRIVIKLINIRNLLHTYIPVFTQFGQRQGFRFSKPND